MSKIYTLVYRANAEGKQQVHVINDKDVRTPAEALAAFQATYPQGQAMAVIDQDLVEALTTLPQKLAEKLEQAAAALPDAWFATQHGVPVELIESIKSLVEESRRQGLLNVQRTITVTHGDGDEFEICADTGKVLTPEVELEDPFNLYERADVQEYLQWAFVSGLARPTSINHMGLRWIHKSGEIEEAESDWRDDLLADRDLGDRMIQPMDHVQWEGEVFHQLCVQGDMSNGDAQGLTEARQDLFDDLYFVQRLKPAAAAKRLLVPAN